MIRRRARAALWPARRARCSLMGAPEETVSTIGRRWSWISRWVISRCWAISASRSRSAATPWLSSASAWRGGGEPGEVAQLPGGEDRHRIPGAEAKEVGTELEGDIGDRRQDPRGDQGADGDDARSGQLKA